MSLPTSPSSSPAATRSKSCDQALRTSGNDFKPMTPEEMDALRARTAAFAGSEGTLEGYKSTGSFDGTVKNPHWLTTASVRG